MESKEEETKFDIKHKTDINKNEKGKTRDETTKKIICFHFLD